ncbi:Protein CBG25977 [Caenorhabditis briggsae]|uniref:Protein CBG25977 n=1 Tax=Caenorhabditis briggsae TaxID=6238 RepID=B6IKS7_CAEBR|nr:Protein CBG25977 [Caenorhabditis briggsae]CAS00507.1 Protein CBG25977 [Caenorhabditis briggsae]
MNWLGKLESPSKTGFTVLHNSISLKTVSSAQSVKNFQYINNLEKISTATTSVFLKPTVNPLFGY